MMALSPLFHILSVSSPKNNCEFFRGWGESFGVLYGGLCFYKLPRVTMSELVAIYLFKIIM